MWVTIYRIRLKYPADLLVGGGRLRLCSSGFNRRMIEGVNNQDLVLYLEYPVTN